jgi:hypothetical protein
MKNIYYALWISHPILQTVIAVIMFRRRQYRPFKFFFAYVLAQILTFAVIFPFRENYTAWFYMSWIGTALSVALGFKVLHEAFLDVFKPFHTLKDMGTVLFKWAGLVMLLVAAVVSLSTNSSETVPWAQAILTTQRCVRVIQVGMVLFLLFFARYLGVTRRQHSFGIALGFGVFAMVELSLVSSWVGEHVGFGASALVNMAAYNCTLVIWLGYCLVKSPAREGAATLLRPQRWEESLTDLQHPLPPDSLIPMFEDMVDRALSRTQSISSSITRPETIPPDMTRPETPGLKSAAAHASTPFSAASEFLASSRNPSVK